MTSPWSSRSNKENWHELALRHIEMARHLAHSGLNDGAAFHAYHAYECVINAVILWNHYPVPPEGMQKTPTGRIYYNSPGGRIPEASTHDVRLRLAEQLIDHAQPFHAIYAVLSAFLSADIRNAALYYDRRTRAWPPERFTRSDVGRLLARVRRFAREVWKVIG